MNKIIFDIDGTICPIKNEHEKYEDLVPYEDIVKKMKILKEQGFKIVLYTARNMKTYSDNINLILKNTKPILEKWLEKWNIPYDEIVFGKPYPGKDGYYVDDKTIRPSELLSMTNTEINELLKGERR